MGANVLQLPVAARSQIKRRVVSDQPETKVSKETVDNVFQQLNRSVMSERRTIIFPKHAPDVQQAADLGLC